MGYLFLSNAMRLANCTSLALIIKVRLESHHASLDNQWKSWEPLNKIGLRRFVSRFRRGLGAARAII